MKRALHRVSVSPRFAAALGLGAALTLLLPHSVVAQPDDAATLADFRACGALQRDSARLACFDGVLAADREDGEIDETADPAPVAEAVAPDASSVAAESTDAQVAMSPEAEPELEPAESPAEPAPAQVASEPREEAGAIPATSAARTPTAAATAADAVESPTLRIVEFNVRIPGSARFVADDGRVFVQTSGTTNYRTFPDVPFPATLEDGALGSQFLRLGPRLRVRVRTVD